MLKKFQIQNLYPINLTHVEENKKGDDDIWGKINIEDVWSLIGEE